jgi:hypothetical protein
MHDAPQPVPATEASRWEREITTIAPLVASGKDVQSPKLAFLVRVAAEVTAQRTPASVERHASRLSASTRRRGQSSSLFITTVTLHNVLADVVPDGRRRP